MSYEPKDNSGALFKNDKKTSPNHPDYKGNITIGGQQFWLSAWIKKNDKGAFMSIAANPKETKPAEPAPSAAPFDDDLTIPF